MQKPKMNPFLIALLYVWIESIQFLNADIYVDECKLKAENLIEPGLPDNFWGCYLPLEPEKEAIFFSKVFPSIPQGTTQCTTTSDFQSTRQYVNIQEPHRMIFSYYCVKSRSYEHIEADMTSGDETFLRFYEKMEDFGITAQEYVGGKEMTEEEEKDAIIYIKPVFDGVKGDIPKDLCPYPTLQTIFYLEQKDENQLHYWRFPVGCELDASRMIEIEVMQDLENCFVKDGELFIVQLPTESMANVRYEERGPVPGVEAYLDLPKSELQSSSHIATLSMSASLACLFALLLNKIY